MFLATTKFNFVIYSSRPAKNFSDLVMPKLILTKYFFKKRSQVNVFTILRPLLAIFIAARVVYEETPTVPCTSSNQKREPATWN